LLNLGSNAVKFTEQGEVILSILVLQRTEDAVTLQFTMRDNGIGIAQENQTRIFSGFTQAESTTTRRFGGTGLGLAITQRFVSMMGGELELQSELGKGSRFYFTLTMPIAPKNGERESRRMQAHAQGTSWRALVIDDNSVAREVLNHMGQSLGWEMDLAESGAQGLQLLHERDTQGIQYQAIFVDWNMPGMDGWQACQQIREFQANRMQAGETIKPPVVLMVTAHGREMLSQRTSDEQSLLDGYLVKPVTTSMLFDAVIDARKEHELPHPSRPSFQVDQRRLDGMRVLLVEDNVNNQQVASELLEYEGALVQIANHGQEAIEAIAAANPEFDVVLMDLQMPVMDGFSATKIIRNDLGLTTLPIVAMTANAMASDRDACLVVGMNDHIGKPFDINALVDVLRKQAKWGETFPVALGTPSALSQELLQAAAAARVDLDVALKRLGGMRGVYQRMLSTFVEDIRIMPTQLQELAHSPDSGNGYEAERRLLHTLKGLAATLGTMGLSAEAAKAERIIKDSPGAESVRIATNHIASAIEDALPSLSALLMAMKQDLSNDGESMNAASYSGQALDRKALILTLTEIEKLLEVADMDSMAVMAQLQQQFGEVLGEDLTALEDAMSNLDFDQALRRCQDLLEKFGKSSAAI
jgi:CheY-like chemotaxis protein